MKTILALVLVVAFSTPIFADEAKVTVANGVVEIRATSPDYASVAVFEQVILHPTKTIKVFAAPAPKPSVKALLRGEKSDLRISRSKTLLEAYREAYDSMLAEMESEEPATAAKMKANPYDLQGNLEHIEKYLGLDKVNTQSMPLPLTTRCYSVCWAEGIYRYSYAKNVELIFE